jgi:NADPH:quinone reductase-like Zn-dependent oxidoreductase
MRAIRIHRFGGPEVLQLDDIPRPEPRDGKLLIRVVAASVNPVDYKIRQGAFPGVKAADLPVTLGRDISGVVETPGAGFAVGDEVYAHLDWVDGGYADCALCGPAGLAHRPASLDMTAAAAVPLAATTAWQGLFDHGSLQAGQRVLIHGAAGGVGAFAVQFARMAGGHVIATATGAGVEQVGELGAEQVIDYREQRFEDAAEPVDLVFDLIGHDTQERSFAMLLRGGRLISTVQEPDPARAAAHGVTAARFMARPNADQLATIGRAIDDGAVKVNVARTFPLPRAADAQRCLEEDHPQGKVVLTVS